MKFINSQNRLKLNLQQKGAVLLEALIAVLIFSFGILAIAGLQAAMIKNTTNSKYRADASFIAQQELGQMWANPDNLGTFAVVDRDISTLLPSGAITISLPAGDQVQVTVRWQVPGDPDQHNHVVNARIVQGGGA